MKSAGIYMGKRGVPHKQHGVVLLIALIILVAMTLAGIGMMRSVDTGSVIAGNMAFRQATLNASDAGAIAAFNDLVSLVNSANREDKKILNFNNGQPCPIGATSPKCVGGVVDFPGYSSVPLDPCEVTGGCTAAQTQWWLNDANWNNASNPIAVTDPTNGTTIATVRYLIHRLCVLPNQEATAVPDAGQLCLAESVVCGKPPCRAARYFFRITARAEGTRNTMSYTQQNAMLDTVN